MEEIIFFFKNYKFEKQDFILDQCSKIVDPEKFVKSHISILTANHSKRTKRTYLVYYNRLLKFYNEQKNNNLY